MRSAAESDKYVGIHYEASTPRKRDFLKVLFGQWKPEVRRVARLTSHGLARELKRAWTSEPLMQQMYAGSPLSSALDESHARTGRDQ